MIQKTVFISLLLVTFHIFSSDSDNPVALQNAFTALQYQFSQFEETLNIEIKKIDGLPLDETREDTLFQGLGFIFPDKEYVAPEYRSQLGHVGITNKQFVDSIAEGFFGLNLNDPEDRFVASQQIVILQRRLKKAKEEFIIFQQRVAEVRSFK